MPLVSPFRPGWHGRPRSRTAGSDNSPKGHRQSRRLLAFLALLLTMLTTAAPAQRVASAAPAHAPAANRAATLNSRNSNFILGRSQHSSGFRRSTPYTSLPFPFFTDSFNPDDIYSSGYPVASQPPPFLLDAARAMGAPSGAFSSTPLASPIEPASSIEPLMIEFQNGRYVRLRPTAADGEAHDLPDAAPLKSAHLHSTPSAISGTSTLTAAAATTRDLPPAVLVFRDGHHEEVSDYTIADGVLYARADYYKDGYWTRKIPLSTLDISQTLQTNRSRNLKFILPASPNQVITRP